MNLYKKAKDRIINRTEDSLIWFFTILMALLILILTAFNEPIFNWIVNAIDSYKSTSVHAEKRVDDAVKDKFVSVKA